MPDLDVSFILGCLRAVGTLVSAYSATPKLRGLVALQLLLLAFFTVFTITGSCDRPRPMVMELEMLAERGIAALIAVAGAVRLAYTARRKPPAESWHTRLRERQRELRKPPPRRH